MSGFKRAYGACDPHCGSEYCEPCDSCMCDECRAAIDSLRKFGNEYTDRENAKLRLLTLARNIRDAAIGCESFARGVAFGFQSCPCDQIVDDVETQRLMRYWHPGHTLQAPPSGEGGEE